MRLGRRHAVWLGTTSMLAATLGAGLALGNGRAPATRSIAAGSTPDRTLAGATFGLLLSRDGCEYRWLCEQSVGYAGTYDPKLALDSQGTIYATTYEGLRISRDQGCTFETAPSTTGWWIDAVAITSQDHVWIATANTGKPSGVFVSTDRGATFTPAGLASPNIWYKSVVTVSATDVWASGYQVAGPNGALPAAFVYHTVDGGQTWTTANITELAVATTPVLLVEAAGPNQTVFVRSVAANNPGDVLYRSTDSGQTFTEVLRTTDEIRGLVMRSATEVLVGSVASGVLRSTDGGSTFAPLATTPHPACLAQLGNGDLLACGSNWDPDFMALGTSADGNAWRKQFRFVELAGPLDCPPGTPQHDVCEQQLWPNVQQQFAATGPTCKAAPDMTMPVADQTPTHTKGCCSGSDGGARLLGFAGVLLVLRRRR